MHWKSCIDMESANLGDLYVVIVLEIEMEGILEIKSS